jgi:hypothetical protein
VIKSAREESQEGKARYYAPLVGVVSDVVDKFGLHRSRVEVPGFAEDGGIWCFPKGGGAPGHGGSIAAVVGQHVLVQFVGGDPMGIALWEAAWWARPASGSEAPGAFRDLPPEDAPLVHVLEVAGFTVAIDARPGKRQLVISDDVLGSVVQVNGVLGEVSVTGSVSLKLEAPRVELNGATVTINGRAVLVSDGPIG